ncbi:hypothetical protein NDK47_04455 [Brevibacillus ruminantium]|uniref:DUF4179 domain-containing protein n=1 Tax=Brevibacillus ruminantium TaxID=2950604 RepID=A0ABY4WKG6_9BACL|nr:hypothetical protein [Brevibacillus ruminantium]USG66557.1 hypothetical protein NDK47_04455 [Brevibacillus ruminantium]
MHDSEQFDRLLKKALSSTIEPDAELNQKILNQLKENDTMKPVYKKRISVALIASTVALTMSITAVAAWQYLSPKQVVEQLGDQKLAKAFEQKNAVKINESVVSGPYVFTLLGIVSGENISNFADDVNDLYPNKTYAVVSISKKDGSKMPDTQDEAYGQEPFFVTPLIKGQKPWQVNIATLNGGYREFTKDGVMYRLIECDGVEMFADRGLYLGINTGTFFDVNAFHYNEETGEIGRNANYEGANALFNLPLDAQKADHEKADKYLKELFQKFEADSDANGELEAELNKEIEEIEKHGVVIPESVKKVTLDKKGMAHYEYDGYEANVFLDPKEWKVGEYKTISVSEGKDGKSALQFSKDAEGAFTGRVVILK